MNTRKRSRRFRAILITKKKIRRLCVATAAFAAAAAVVVCSRLTVPQAVPAFSGEDIINDGMPTETNGIDIAEIIADILGFDKDKPQTILESASGIYSVPSEGPTEETVASPTKDTSSADISPTEAPPASRLPSKAEIARANDLKISNATGYNVDLNQLCAADLNISLEKDKPGVLIMHTHTTECYDGDEMDGESERTTDEGKNMCAVGDAIEQTLAQYGIIAIHDKTIHDYPTYKGSYTRALETIENNITAEPSIRVVLDVHRDAYIYNDGTKLSVKTEINGENAAQVMLVLGTDSMGLYHPHWRQNLTLAAKIQNAAEIMYPGLMRSLNLRRERFNMHVTTGSLLIEVGANGNTLDEAIRGGKYFAEALAAVLCE